MGCSLVASAFLTTLITKIFSHLPAWAPQFCKYVLCGGTAFLTHTILVTVLGHTVNPAFDVSLGDEVRFQRAAVNNTIAFFLSNTVAYFLNVKFVFKSGRHGRRTEVGLFFLASAIGFFPALYSLEIIINRFSLNTYIANFGFAIVAAAGNFVARKFLIFKE